MTAVSIIIPTHNRRDRIIQTLAAFAQQTYPLSQIELVVVADGCKDDTVAALNKLICPFALQLHEQPGSGPSVARNLGAAYASGDLLIFIDDDIEVVPGFVAAHVAAHQEPGDTVAIGHLPMAPAKEDSFFAQGIRDWWNGRFFDMSQPGYRFGYDDLFSGNFSISAILFATVNGFETKLRCHEDYEMGLRLLQQGAIFVFAHEATGIHHDNTDMARSLQRRVAEGEADVYLAQQYPQLAYRLPIANNTVGLLTRALRYLAIKRPFIGDKLVALLLYPLNILEKLLLFGVWSHLFTRLQDYWYWRGVATAVGGVDGIHQLFQDCAAPAIPALMIDLADGLTAAEEKLDQHRPPSVRLCIKGQTICDIPAQIGKELLRGVHLRRLLTTKLSKEALTALGMATVVDTATAVSTAVKPPTPSALTGAFKRAKSQQLIATSPKKVIAIELSEPIQPIDLTGFKGLHGVVSLHKRPFGTITLTDLSTTTISAAELNETIRQQLGAELMSLALRPTELPSVVSIPSITVIVCTRDRAGQLAGCLDALQAQNYPQFEIVVVDNASCTDATAKLAAKRQVRYVREDRPGLDWARNRGIESARHEIVAFTDDDARPAINWLRAIATAFAEPEVTAVTGPVAPSELNTPTQNLFEFGYGGMSHGFERRLFRRHQLSSNGLLWASGFGVGANMAFRRSVFKEIGLFDVALDVGTVSGGGGDIEMFHRLVAAEHTLMYDPSLLVWHQHRSEKRDMELLVKNNGRSFGCYLLTCRRNRTVSTSQIVRFAVHNWGIQWILKRLVRPEGFPRRSVLQEFVAFIGSPFAYIAAQRRANALRKIVSDQTVHELETAVPIKNHPTSTPHHHPG